MTNAQIAATCATRIAGSNSYSSFSIRCAEEILQWLNNKDKEMFSEFKENLNESKN